MNQQKLNAWWWEQQGLSNTPSGAANQFANGDGVVRASPEQILQHSGWARSVGGAGPYISLFSRGGIGREAADQAVADLSIHELPSARGCTYVVPAADFALALKVGQAASETPINTAMKYCDVTSEELEQLYQAVMDALPAGLALTPNQLKEACGDAIRNLGEAGKKRGMTTTLPLALGYLQAHGEIRRVPVNGRLDQQRFAYTRWNRNPLQHFSLTIEEAYTELARHYFRWIGPASLKHFQWFSGLGVAASKKAIAPLGLMPIDAEGSLLILPEDAERFTAFTPAATPQYALVSSLDAIMLLRREFKGLIAPEHQDHSICNEKGNDQPIGSLSDAPCHVILDRGQIIGFWEFDPEQAEIVWMTFDEPADELLAVIAQMEDYARDQLGDVRTFSLDSPASRQPKLTWLRNHRR